MVIRKGWMLQWRNIKETLMSKINEVDIGEAGEWRYIGWKEDG